LSETVSIMVGLDLHQPVWICNSRFLSAIQ